MTRRWSETFPAVTGPRLPASALPPIPEAMTGPRSLEAAIFAAGYSAARVAKGARDKKREWSDWLASGSKPDEPREDRRRGWWRRLTLIGPTGRPFLDRHGVDVRWFGVYLHRILDPDPGLDLHDHPWAFVTVVLRGGYVEEYADVRQVEESRWRWWTRGSVHRMPLSAAHRIIHVEPGTLTLVLRGSKCRRWGFFQGGRWVDWEAYDFEARRPVHEVRR